MADDIECSCGEPGRVAPDGWTERHRTDGPCYLREHDERFVAVWEAIKRWDISTPADQGIYSGATGDEVCMRVSTGYLRRLQQEANNELDRRYFAAVAAEIERLRAERDELQALIDTWADSHRQALVLDPPDAAVRAWMRHTVNSSRLLKAATKEDDRG